MIYYLLYLPSKFDRVSATLEHLNEVEISPVLFKGVDAVTNQLYTKLEKNECGLKFTSGRIGCFLSHYMLWNHLYHSNIEEAIILEDDVRFVDGYKTLYEDYMNQLPEDWQYVFLGSAGALNNFEQSVSKNIIRSKPYCTHAYMIKRSALKTLLEECYVMKTYVDMQIRQFVLPKLKYYVFHPPLIDQMSLESDEFGVYKSMCKDWEFDID